MRSPEPDPEEAGAVFSPNRNYRYRLWREWEANAPRIAFLMLNPSSADETSLDPTCRRCRGYAEAWGYGRMEIGNLFARRASEPAMLREADAPVGPENDRHLRTIVASVDRIVAAWGVHGEYRNRGRTVYNRLDVDFYAIDTTKDGHPIHPLYQPKDVTLNRFEYQE